MRITGEKTALTWGPLCGPPPPDSFPGLLERPIEERRTLTGSSPISRIGTEPYEPVEGTVGPLPRSTDQAVFDRIIMSIVVMPFKIVLVPDGVLPESPLPDTSPPIPETRIADRLLRATLRQPGFRELLL